MEGLGEVVVGSETQAGDSIVGRARRSQHQHHDWLVALGDHPAERVSVQTGEVPIEYDDVVRVDVEL